MYRFDDPAHLITRKDRIDAAERLAYDWSYDDITTGELIAELSALGFSLAPAGIDNGPLVATDIETAELVTLEI